MVNVLVVSVLLGGAACGADPTKPPPHKDPAELFWSLELSRRAVMLSTTAPYDTLTVTAMPYNYYGDALSGLPIPNFVSSDPLTVSVSSSGTLIALGPGTASVVATLVADNLRHMDTISVVVVDDPAPVPLGRLSMDPVPPDSAKWPACSIQTICASLNLEKFIRLTDPEGLAYPYATQVPIEIRVADTAVAQRFDSRLGIAGKKAGVVDVYARTTVFGATRADTLSVRFGWPLAARLDVAPLAEGSHTNIFVEPRLKLGVGAFVIFFDQAPGVPTDIVFDDSTHVESFNSIRWEDDAVTGRRSLYCSGIVSDYSPSFCDEAGNVSLDGSVSGYRKFWGFAVRVFNTPGTYTYRSTMHGTGGVITVIDESVGAP